MLALDAILKIIELPCQAASLLITYYSRYYFGPKKPGAIALLNNT